MTFDPTRSVVHPPRLLNMAGESRKVGLEVEFAGISARDTAGAIARKFGGTTKQINRHRYAVVGTVYGDFRAELDSRYAHPEGVLPTIDTEKSDWLRRLTEIVSGTIGDTGALVIPCEVVTPPIPIGDLPVIDEFLAELMQAGARGTDQSVFYAFGLHLNPEIATDDAGWLISIVRSQILLSTWLRSVMAIDLSRYMTGFTAPFPTDYADLVLQPDYLPSQQEFISDYLRFNPTRDRELDLLPLFATLDEDRVAQSVQAEKISPRPTFHCRLPNAALERPAWSIVLEWNRWCLVERLADDKAALYALTAAFDQSKISTQDVSWALRTSEWLAHGLNAASPR